jgi:TatD DNase family protein
MYTDSHAHLSSAGVFPHIEAILQKAQLAGVSKIVNICTDVDSLKKGLELHQRYPWVYNTAATTPHDVEKEGEEVFEIIAEQAKQGNLVAIGETGLDYYYEHSNREVQQHFLKRYLQLSLECQLPVVIHCREAFKDFFQIIDMHYPSPAGVLHCFTGTLEEAEEVIKRGWYLSISGIVTFKKSEELRAVAKRVPLEQLLIETDTPYLAPQSQRGKSNEPAFLPEIAGLIATVKGLSLEEVAKATSQNAANLFHLT